MLEFTKQRAEVNGMRKLASSTWAKLSIKKWQSNQCRIDAPRQLRKLKSLPLTSVDHILAVVAAGRRLAQVQAQSAPRALFSIDLTFDDKP